MFQEDTEDTVATDNREQKDDKKHEHMHQHHAENDGK